MSNSKHPLEKLVQIIPYRGVELELVERPDVLWVGCVDYAANHTDESDVGATLRRFQGLNGVARRELVNPGWSAALSIHYTCDDKPCGILFANETYSEEQDERFELFTQPGGLWLRLRNSRQAAEALLGKEAAELYEYFAGPRAPLQRAAEENGYSPNPEVPVQVEYNCHEEYGAEDPAGYAYIPVVKA